MAVNYLNSRLAFRVLVDQLLSEIYWAEMIDQESVSSEEKNKLRMLIMKLLLKWQYPISWTLVYNSACERGFKLSRSDLTREKRRMRRMKESFKIAVALRGEGILMFLILGLRQ